MSYTCQNCGVTAEESSKLCNPASETESGNICGVSADKVCSGSMEEMKYTCGTCGSLSATFDNLCSPSEIK
jgi:hypothetical protein